MVQVEVTEAEQAKVEFTALQALILAPPPAPAMTTPTMVDPKGKLSIDLHSHPDTDEEDCKQDDGLEIDACMQHFGEKRKSGACSLHQHSSSWRGGDRSRRMVQAEVTKVEQAKVAKVEFKALQALILAPPPAPAMTTPTMVDPKGKLSIDLHSHPDTDEEDCKQDDVLEIDAWMQHFGGKRKAFGPRAVLAHNISTLLADEVVIVHAKYSPNGRYNLFALKSLSKTLCLSTLAQSANMKVLVKTTFATSVFGGNFRVFRFCILVRGLLLVQVQDWLLVSLRTGYWLVSGLVTELASCSGLSLDQIQQIWFTGSGPSAGTQGSATQDPHIAASDSSSDFDVMEGYPMQQHPESFSQDMHALGQQPGISMFNRLKETLSRATHSEHATNEINEGSGEVDLPFTSHIDPVLSESAHVSTPTTTPIGFSKLTPSETLLPDGRSLAEVQKVERYILAAREKEIESLRKAEQRRATLAKAPMTSANPLQSPELTTLKSQPIGSHIASGSKDTSNTSILDGVFLNENWEYNLQTEKLTDLYTSYTYHVGWLDVIQATSNSTSVDEQQRMICDVIHSIVQMERENLGINMPSMGPMRFLNTTKAKQPTISQMETPSVSPMDPSYIVSPRVSIQSESTHGSFSFPDLVQLSLGDLPTPTMNMIGGAPSTSMASTTPLHTSVAPMPISVGEVISNSSLVQAVLDALPNSYQTFASTWRLMNQRNLEVVKFYEVCTLLLQEALSKKKQQFVWNFVDKGKKKMRFHYCKANDHLIKQCPKLKAKEAKKKEGDSTANAGSTTNATVVVSLMKEDCDADADAEWAFNAKCTYNLDVHDACMSVAADSHVWYFDRGATKHITSHRDLFTSLESIFHGNSVTCANNASYPV
ncbi:hypothetical protein L7F22_008498 [Adiantum nelumboides]|nr:hypothetical protein [Adiantum nelumboides]